MEYKITNGKLWMRDCLKETVARNRDIGITLVKAMPACSFAYRNRNNPVEPKNVHTRIRMFLTGEINPKDPKWVSKEERL